jgi:hypothetical protein
VYLATPEEKNEIPHVGVLALPRGELLTRNVQSLSTTKVSEKLPIGHGETSTLRRASSSRVYREEVVEG